MSERIKEQQEMERRMARLAKNMDHLERARREEEAPYLEAAWKERQEADRAYWEQSQAEAARLHRQAWEVDVEEKKRLVGDGDRGGGGGRRGVGASAVLWHCAPGASFACLSIRMLTEARFMPAAHIGFMPFKLTLCCFSDVT